MPVEPAGADRRGDLGAAFGVAGREEQADVAAGARRAREIVLGGELRAQARRLREAYRAG